MAKWDISALSSALEHDTTQGLYSALCQIDSTHFLVVYQGTSADGFAQVLEVNSSTYAVTEVGTPIEFDTLNLLHPSVVKVDSTHFFVMWSGDGSDGFAQILTVNTSTWAVTAEGTALEFDTTLGQYTACFLLDSTHVLGVYAGSGSDGFARVFTINSSTWAVTAETALEFDTTLGQFNSVVQVDSNHFVNFWYGSTSIGRAQAFTVNLSTWAVTAEGSAITFDSNANAGQFNRAVLLDDNHILNAWYGELTQKARVFEVNLSTWAVTAVGTEFDVDTDTFAGQNTLHGSVVALDETHVLLPWRAGTSAGGDDGFVRVFEINNSTWNITAVGTSALEFDTTDLFWPAVVKMDMGHVIMAWGGSASDGYAQCFDIEVSPTIVQNTADATDFSTDTTPTLQFTGTDLNADSIRYQIQISSINTFSKLIDSHSESNKDTDTNLGNVTKGFGQSFTGDGNQVGSIQLYLKKVASPTGNAVVKIYAHSGTFASSSVPTGAALATSATLDVSTLSTSYALISFSFSGAEQITLTNGTKYVLTIEYDSGGSGNINLGTDLTSSTAAGSFSYLDSGSWFSDTGDMCFYVYSNHILLDKLSGTDSGFANTTDGGDTDPFDSGDLASFTVQAGDALATDTYYWRVRALDPAGSNVWSDWSATRSFTVSSGAATNSERGAKVRGQDVSNAERSAKIKGQDTSTAERAAKITGVLGANAERAAKIYGQDIVNAERNAKVRGFLVTNDERDAKIRGQDSATTERPSKIHGVDTSSTERDAKIRGALASNAERDAKIHGIDSVNNERSAKVRGSIDVNDSRDAKIYGVDTINNERAAKIRGFLTDSSERSSKIRGQESSNNERQAKIYGQVISTDDRNAKIHGIDTTSNERDAKIRGSLSSDSERAAKVTGIEASSSERDAKVHGIDSTSSERNSKIRGKDVINDERSAKIRGQNISNDEKDAKVHGQDTANNERAAKIYGTGGDIITNERSAKITGAQLIPFNVDLIFVNGKPAKRITNNHYILI